MSYNNRFKIQAVKLLKAIQRHSYVVVDGHQLESVRALVSHLGVSSASLYKWEKQYDTGELGLKEVTERDIHPNIQNRTEQQEIQKSVRREVLSDEIAKEVKTGKLFGLRFFGWMAKTMGVRGYSRMSLADLKKEIGARLVLESNCGWDELEQMIFDML